MLVKYKIIFRMLIMTACAFVAVMETRAGLLYVLNQQNGAPNQIYGFGVNETTGALSLLAGYPVSSGGNGTNASRNKQMVIDRANQRLYVLNDGSDTIGAFSIDLASGQLIALPFSPIVLPAGIWTTVAVHPSGSPLVVGDADATPVFASFTITAASATPAAGSPYSAAGAPPAASVFSRDGYFFYGGGANSTAAIAGFSVNRLSGVLTPLPSSPFNSGSLSPSGYETDSYGRFFMTAPTDGVLRAFTTTNGIPAAVTNSPFPSGLVNAVDGVLHPNQRSYYVADRGNAQVGAYSIAGDETSTTLSAMSGSPVFSGGSQTNSLAINGSGNYLFAANNNSRNISIYALSSSGLIFFDSVLPANTLGTNGNVAGLAYLPTVFTVTNLNDSGPGSLREAITSATSANSGAMIVFDRVFFSSPRTIELTTGQLVIGSHLNIVGPGAHMLTVRNVAAPSTTSRVINLSSASTVSLSGMTLTGGNPTGSNVGGGGILSNNASSILTIADCLITGNTTIGFGGGIANHGTLSVINSTISNNRATFDTSSGGGITHNSGTMFITNSTISGNVKSGNGSLDGGGILVMFGRTTITNSTITNNLAPSGAGGLMNLSSVTVRNSIIAGNRNNTAMADIIAVAPGVITSAGFNLIGNRGSSPSFNQPGDQTGTSASPLDPGLVKVLAYKGGTVPVHVLLPHSTAVDRGSNSNITTDQRGFARPFDTPGVPNTFDASDIGAFERRAQESIFTAPFDFDGDGKTDIGIFRPGPAEWWINQSSTGVTSAAQFGSSSFPIVPADYTGDGKTDIAFWRPSDGFWFIVRSEDFSFFAFPFGTNGDIPMPADYDGDAKADPAVFRPSIGTWFISNSSGGTTIEGFGVNGDRPVSADYDGDGRADIAIFRLSNGQWWMKRSTAGVIAVTFGSSNDRPVQSDYTGDGKADAAFWRLSTGEWFVLRSEDFSFFAFPFGTTNDVPAPGDYDGDGKHDATVFRPLGATWFSQQTNAGTVIRQFGVAADRPIPNAFVP